MATITLPKTLTDGTAADALDVMADLNAITAQANGNLDGQNIVAAVTGRRLIERATAFVEVGLPNGTYYFTPVMVGQSTLAKSANAGQGISLINLAAADYAVPGRTTKLVLKGLVATNAVPPGINFTFGLYPLSALSGSSGTTMTATLGTVVPGSAVAINAPIAGAPTGLDSSVFTFPADGVYALGVVLSTGNAAGCLALNASLFVLNV